MSKVNRKVCVVTGAGSGIGRELALELGRRGARAIAISDVNDENLAETARLLAEHLPAVTVHQQHLDVSDRDAFIAYADAVAGQFGVVHQIYNNAGIASGKTIRDANFEIYDRVIGVNLFGVIHGTKVFLPHLIASGDGHVTNISSLNGFMAQDELSAYCTTKFGVRGFTETLRIEMLRDKLPVKVTVVHPGGVKTNIATSGLQHAAELGYEVTDHERRRVEAYNEKLLRMPAAVAAKIIIDGVENDKPRVLVGNDAKVIDKIVRLAPASYPRLTLALNKLAKMAAKSGALGATGPLAGWPRCSARYATACTGTSACCWIGSHPPSSTTITQDHRAALLRADRDAAADRGLRGWARPGSTVKRRSTSLITIFISCSANAAPKQRRRPPPNGIHV